MLTKEAIDLLERTKAYIREEPKRFEMSDWGKRDSITKGKGIPPCGTTACIAGTMYLLGEPGIFKDLEDNKFNIQIYESSKYACSILGCYDGSEHPLFYKANWPFDMRIKYNLGAAKERVEVACEMIDRYIAERNSTGDTNDQD